jgi:hypothetical protein
MKRLSALLVYAWLALSALTASAQEAGQGSFRLVVSFGSVCCGPDGGAIQRVREAVEQAAQRIGQPVAVVTGFWGPEGDTAYCFQLNEMLREERSRFIEQLWAALKQSVNTTLRENETCPGMNRRWNLGLPCTHAFMRLREPALLEIVSRLLQQRMLDVPEVVAHNLGTCIRYEEDAKTGPDGIERIRIWPSLLPTVLDDRTFHYERLRLPGAKGWEADLEMVFAGPEAICVTPALLREHFHAAALESGPLDTAPVSDRYLFANHTSLSVTRYVRGGARWCAAGLTLTQRDG